MFSFGQLTKRAPSSTEKHHNIRCSGRRFCLTSPCSVAPKPLRRGLFQPSSGTNEQCPTSCKDGTPRVKLMRRQALGGILVEGLFSLSCPTKSSKQGHRVAAGKSSRSGSSGLSQEGLPSGIFDSINLRPSACKRGKTRWYGSAELTMSGTCLRVLIFTRLRLCSVDKPSAILPQNTTRHAGLCLGAATSPATPKQITAFRAILWGEMADHLATEHNLGFVK